MFLYGIVVLFRLGFPLPSTAKRVQGGAWHLQAMGAIFGHNIGC